MIYKAIKTTIMFIEAENLEEAEEKANDDDFVFSDDTIKCTKSSEREMNEAWWGE